jgi:exodeoxyribonuclease VII large subunit
VELASLRHLNALLHAVQTARGQAAALLQRLSPASISNRLRAQRAGLAVLSAQLDGASYERVLARGFALVRYRQGGPVTSAKSVKPGNRLTISFVDGEVKTTVDRGPVAQSELAL